MCILEKKKLMTDDGKLNKPKILDYIDMVMRPEEVKGLLKDGISKCMEEHGTRNNFYRLSCKGRSFTRKMFV